MDGPIGVIYSPWVEEASPMADALAKELRGGFEPWVCSVLDLEEHEQQARKCSIFVTVAATAPSCAPYGLRRRRPSPSWG